jgi:hypothetical protein
MSNQILLFLLLYSTTVNALLMEGRDGFHSFIHSCRWIDSRMREGGFHSLCLLDIFCVVVWVVSLACCLYLSYNKRERWMDRWIRDIDSVYNRFIMKEMDSLHPWRLSTTMRALIVDSWMDRFLHSCIPVV